MCSLSNFPVIRVLLSQPSKRFVNLFHRPLSSLIFNTMRPSNSTLRTRSCTRFRFSVVAPHTKIRIPGLQATSTSRHPLKTTQSTPPNHSPLIQCKERTTKKQKENAVDLCRARTCNLLISNRIVVRRLAIGPIGQLVVIALMEKFFRM